MSEEPSSSSDGVVYDEQGRRKWDKGEWAKRATDRLNDLREGKKEKPVKREELKPRDYKVDLDSRLGKSVVIMKTTPLSEHGGYYCDVCDCVVKDSINFLDHINGKKHQRNLGMSMKPKHSTVQEVRERVAAKKATTEQVKKDYDMQERLAELKEEEEKMVEYKKQKRLEMRKRKRAEMCEDADPDPELAAIMGFGGFGTTGGKK